MADWEPQLESYRRGKIRFSQGLTNGYGDHKGQPFQPDARMQEILAEAAVTVRTLASRPRKDMFYDYPGKGVWTTPFIGGSYLFLDKNNARYLDARAYFHFYATGITPAMTQAPYGKGSVYAVAFMDSTGKEGNWLQTIPGKSWFIALRMYGPLTPWMDKTWRPGELQLVK